MKNHKITFLSLAILTLFSCNRLKNKVKTTVNKTGEIVAQTGSEFGEGVYKGVKKTFQNDIELSDNLKNDGLSLGEISINSTDTTTDNILTAYLIFNDDFEQNVTVKVRNSEGKEFGRVSRKIKGKAGQTQYVDFIFDKRVHIGMKGKIIME